MKISDKIGILNKLIRGDKIMKINTNNVDYIYLIEFSNRVVTNYDIADIKDDAIESNKTSKENGRIIQTIHETSIDSTTMEVHHRLLAKYDANIDITDMSKFFKVIHRRLTNDMDKLKLTEGNIKFFAVHKDEYNNYDWYSYEFKGIDTESIKELQFEGKDDPVVIGNIRIGNPLKILNPITIKLLDNIAYAGYRDECKNLK